MSYRLTAEHRSKICIHEAAHATIAAIAGMGVYRITVAPSGVTKWRVADRKGMVSSDNWGFCEHSDDTSLVRMFMAWDDDNSGYTVDIDGFNSFIDTSLKAIPKLKEDLAKAIEASICISLAGPIADYLQDDFVPSIDDMLEHESFGVIGGDVAVSIVFSSFLNSDLPETPFAKALNQTVEMLQHPEIWSGVVALGNLLEQKGEVLGEEMKNYLPRYVIGWPAVA